MSTNIRVLVITIFLFFVCTSTTFGQPRKGKSIGVTIGYGSTFPYSDVDVYGSGFYGEGEYIIGIKKWFGVRPYAGFILTSTQNGGNLKAETKAFLIGSKVRVLAPIPWVAPFIEVGIGASLGSAETIARSVNLKKEGIILHFPFSLGLAIGRKHRFELAFKYYYQESVEQIAGAASIGFSFPLNLD